MIQRCPRSVDLIHDLDGEIDLGRGLLDDMFARAKRSFSILCVTSRVVAELGSKLGNSAR